MLIQEIIRAEWAGQNFNQGLKNGRFTKILVRGYTDLNGVGVAEFLEELAAMATGGGGDGEGDKGGAFVDGEVGEKGLFCVDRMVE